MSRILDQSSASGAASDALEMSYKYQRGARLCNRARASAKRVGREEQPAASTLEIEQRQDTGNLYIDNWRGPSFNLSENRARNAVGELLEIVSSEENKFLRFLSESVEIYT